MIKIFTLLFALSIFGFQSCKNDKVEPRPAIADVPLNAFDMRSSGDTSSTDLTYPSTLTLNSDKTWTLNFGGAQSFGTYSWKPTITYTADIKFNITQWEVLGADTAKSSKLKNIILSLNRCEFPGTTLYGVNFFSEGDVSYLRTHK